MSRAYAYVVSVLVLGVVLAPAFGDPHDDGFPLSTYPMFSTDRRGQRAVLPAVLAVDAKGDRHRVPPALVSSSDALQALVTLRRTLREGPRATRALCEAIAARLAQSDEAAWQGVRQVEIVMQSLDAIAYFTGGGGAADSVVQARCPVAAP